MAVGKTLVLNDEGLPGEINTMAGWGVIGSRPATGDVLAGSFYFDTTNSILYQEQDGSWVAVLSIKTLNAANETVEAGYYAATTLSAIDAQLAAVNILSGVNIFGFVGVATVQDIADADLVIAQAPTGKKFYAVTGGVKTGTGTKTLNPANETVQAGYYAATTLSAVDPDLAVSNILLGVNIFGKVGTYDPVITEEGSGISPNDHTNQWRDIVSVTIGAEVKKVIMVGSGDYNDSQSPNMKGYYNGVERFAVTHPSQTNEAKIHGRWTGNGIGSSATARISFHNPSVGGYASGRGTIWSVS